MSSLAEELRDLQRRVADMPVGGEAGGVTLAQNHDLVEQTLGELAAFLDAAAPSFGEAPLEGLQPAFDAIRLAALARRLRGEAVRRDESDGELELL